MRTLLLALLLILTGPASAAIMVEADIPGGGVVLFHDTAGPCIGDALMVEYVGADGKRIPGCFVDRGGHLACVFFDGDVGSVPKAALRRPKDA